MNAVVSSPKEPTADTAVASKAAQPAPASPPAPSTALALRENDDVFWRALEPRNFEECRVLAKVVFDAKMFRVKSPEDALIRIMTGRGLRLPMFAALKGLYAVPDGDGSNDIGLYAKLKVAMCLQRDDCEYLEFVERTPEQATWVAKRKGRPEKKLTFTYQEAIEAGLVDRGEDEAKKKKNNWNRYRSDMLTARCSARLADLVWPEASLGLESKEDLDDRLVIDVPGEVVSEATAPMPVQAAPVRDFAAEAAELKKRIDSVKTPEELKALRADFAIFKKDAPGAICDDVSEYYAKVQGAKVKGQSAPQAAQQPAKGGDDTLFGPPPANRNEAR